MRKHRPRGRAWTKETGSAAAAARWRKVRAGRSDCPLRETRVVELTVRDSHRTRRVIRMESDLTRDARAWGRWSVSENGRAIGRRRFGRSAIADLIARSLE